MLRTLFVPVLIGLVGLGACARPPDDPHGPRRGADLILTPDTVTIAGRVPRNATLSTLLRDQEIGEEMVPTIVAIARQVFDPRRLKADHPFRLVRTIDGLLRHFEYEVDNDRYLRIVGDRSRPPDALTAELVPYKKERAWVSLAGDINASAPSLFAAMGQAGETPELSLELADIFGGEIDFNSDLQPGDHFGLTVEKVFREGRFSGYGALLGAEFVNNGRVLKAIRFTVPGGKPAYYDEQGRSLRRFFLASPLKFILAPRVSSAFTGARFHPILRIYRPHLGVDYVAPAGSPVVAVSSGIVVSAGWNGEAGRMVHLRHASGYETLYMHLSSIAVRAGQRVSQGETIGRVGSTGMSTGPHLDYRIRKDGRAMDPQFVHRSLPPGEPIPSAAMPQFTAERDRVLSLLIQPAGQ